MKIKDLQNEINRAKKNLIKIEKEIDELENENDITNENDLTYLYKAAKEIEDEIEIYKYLAQKYFKRIKK